MKHIVTKESMITMVSNGNPEYVKQVIGRALVAIFNNQTHDEKDTNETRHLNNIGFMGSDAHSGSLTAKFFLKNKTLTDWQVDLWMKPWRDMPRICKYHRQLDQVAQLKKQQS